MKKSRRFTKSMDIWLLVAMYSGCGCRMVGYGRYRASGCVDTVCNRETQWRAFKDAHHTADAFQGLALLETVNENVALRKE